MTDNELILRSRLEETERRLMEAEAENRRLLSLGEDHGTVTPGFWGRAAAKERQMREAAEARIRELEDRNDR